jgi:hypothetical protein
MSLKQIDPGIPWVKSNAMFALTQKYSTEGEALKAIDTYFAAKYPADARALRAADEVKKIYKNNFFPEMKADWSAYPDNIGHKDWPGCYRCHDGSHKAADGKSTIKASDCDTCHTILAQGQGEQLLQLTPQSQPFKHPGDEVDGACNDCHTGGL